MAAADVKRLAGEPARLLGGEKDDHVRHISGIADAAQRIVVRGSLGANDLHLLHRERVGCGRADILRVVRARYERHFARQTGIDHKLASSLGDGGAGSQIARPRGCSSAEGLAIRRLRTVCQ